MSSPSSSQTVLGRIRERLRKDIQVISPVKKGFKKSNSLQRKLERTNRQLIYFSKEKDREDRKRNEKREAEVLEKRRKEEERKNKEQKRKRKEEKKEQERKRKEEKDEEERRRARREEVRRIKKEEEQKRLQVIKERNKDIRDQQVVKNVMERIIEEVVMGCEKVDDDGRDGREDEKVEDIIKQMKLPAPTTPIKRNFIKLSKLKVGRKYKVVGGGEGNVFNIQLNEDEVKQVFLPRSKSPPPTMEKLFLLKTKGEEKNIKYIYE